MKDNTPPYHPWDVDNQNYCGITIKEEMTIRFAAQMLRSGDWGDLEQKAIHACNMAEALLAEWDKRNNRNE